MPMYLLDTNVVSELRKKEQMNTGVSAFFDNAERAASKLYLSAITIGELRRGVELIRDRGDTAQASALESWLMGLLEEHEQNILPFGSAEAQVWGRLRSPHHEHALDKQIAATALIYDLTLVTRNIKDFKETGVKLLNPFI